jgi:hypothetical protein
MIFTSKPIPGTKVKSGLVFHPANASNPSEQSAEAERHKFVLHRQLFHGYGSKRKRQEKMIAGKIPAG